MKRITIFLAFIELIGVNAFGQTSVQRGNEQKTTISEQIKLTLKPSRAQAASDTSFAISAEIENTSQESIFLNSGFLTLTVPPEVDPFASDTSDTSDTAPEWTAFLPATGPGDPDKKIVTLQPGSRTLAVFSLTRNPHWGQRFMAALRFVPGNYTVHVVCSYWKKAEDAKQRRPNYLTQIAETTLPVVAPQTAILSGAALGGLMAFILLPSLWLPISKKLEDHDWKHQVFIVARGLTVASLLSVMVAILLSRVSDSQFPIRVSVQDFWGAVAIGFIAGASGTTVLQRFNLAQDRQSKEAAAATASVGGKELTQRDVAGTVEEAKTKSSTPPAKAA